MAFRKFGPNDVNINTMKAHPKSEFFIYDSCIYYNNQTRLTGSWVDNVDGNLQTGYVNLYEYNIDRIENYNWKGLANGNPSQVYWNRKPTNPLIYPFLTKDSSRISFKSAGAITASTFDSEFMYGDILYGNYPQAASITREYIDRPSDLNFDQKMSFVSLKNLLNLYGVRSPAYLVSSSEGGDKNDMYLNLIHIPSIFYGTRIKPGTISLRMYQTGTLIGELQDTKENGELIQTSGFEFSQDWPERTGSVAGVALYDEGFLLLTGSWKMSDRTFGLVPDEPRRNPRWIYWGAGANDGVTKNSSTESSRFDEISFALSFQGETKTQTIQMMAHAKRGEANYSHNPSFLEKGQPQLFFTSSHVYEENPSRQIKNTVSSSFSDYSASFKRQVYISKIGVYDEDKNLIGIATLADPVLKEEDEDLTFKIKLDI